MDQFVSGAQLEGEILGNSINFGGPLAFYAFILLLFKNWAVSKSQTAKSSYTVKQEEIELMDEYGKTKLKHEITGEISILRMQLGYIEAALNNTQPADTLAITAVDINESDIRYQDN